ncbi:DUF6777 domain-containing protein [Streptomyces sp. NPDC051173]|uniref:DUF6777 domain-containing protein n=1 Tax=Streptomyces sp. NPDC051173 TaxID=3155164 RepID=UPI00344D8833
MSAARSAALRRRRMRAVALLTVPALLGGVAVTGCTTAQKKKAAELTLEAVGTLGDHPFLRNPGTDLKGVNSPTGGGGTKAVDARGAFGGTPGAVHCDKALLIKQITQDPVEAQAWAQARGIDQNGIAAHIEGLTEVVLLDDTLVENHDYQGDGRTRAYLSVLQKGVAVLNDPYTGPAVKCNCGNPLGEPDHDVDLKASTYVGTRWETFSETTVTVITPRARDKGPVKEVPLVDPFENDKAFDRGAGTDGNHDSATFHWNPPPRRTPSSPGHTPGDGRGSSGTPGDSAGARTPTGSRTPGDSTGTRTPTDAQSPSQPTGSPSGVTEPTTAPPTGASRAPATKAPPTGTRTGAPQPTASAQEAVPTKAPPTEDARPPTTAEQPTRHAKSPSAGAEEPSRGVKSPPPKEDLPTAARTPRADVRTPPTAAGPVLPTSEAKPEAPPHHETAHATAPAEPPAEPRQPAGTHATGSYGTHQGNR